MGRLVASRWPVSLGFALALLAAWELAGALGQLPRYILPPLEIAGALVTGFTEGGLPEATVTSLRRALAGFVIGAGTGTVLGLVAGGIRLADDLVDPLVALTYALPKIALFPVIAVWLGFTDPARVLVIALACLYPSYLNAYSGTKGIDPGLLWVARNLGANRAQTFQRVVLRAALPRLFVGLRVSLALSLVVLFSAEVISAGGGLGGTIFSSYLGTRLDLMYAAIVTLALLGLVGDRLLVAVSRVATRGQALEMARHG